MGGGEGIGCEGGAVGGFEVEVVAAGEREAGEKGLKGKGMRE